MTAAQLSRLQTNRSQLLAIMRNLMDLAHETNDEEGVIWASAQIRRACEKLDEVR